MAQLGPYLNFDGNCREAMEFYKSCLGGELTFMTVEGSPMASQVPENYKNQIMHSSLQAEGITLMASDTLGFHELKLGNNVSLCLVGNSEDEVKTLFSKLSEGGKVSAPLKEEFFGWFGMFTDKFGIQWMVQFGKEKK